MRRAAAENKIEVRALTHGHYYGTPLAENILPGVCTVGYWNARSEQNWKLAWHRNEGLELDFEASGSNGFATTENQASLRSDDLAVVRPWQLHQIGTPSVRRGVRLWLILDVGITDPNSAWSWPSWVSLTDPDKARLTSILLNLRHPVFHLPKKYARAWKNLYRELQNGDDEVNYSRIALLINEILFSLMTFAEDARCFYSSDTPLSLRIIQDFIRDFELRPHLLRQPWTVALMAKQCGLSVSTFCARFRECTNMSPNQYLIQARIDQAQKLLARGEVDSVAQLADEAGFATSQYFATVFKKITGRSPSEFLDS